MSGEGSETGVVVRLQESLGAGYVVARELGGGGMSRVFVANDTTLHRQVVVKLLAPELAAGISAERFEREIRLAASLQQANIVPLLSAGRSGELPYYTMPYVEGRSLREHLADHGPLPIRDAVSALRDIARALAYAHARGVVHRDIKPGNVLLSGGTAVVTDFGIAKALSAARGEWAPETLTGTGVGLGTAAYMAPEQAAGDPSLDHRADIYALGCVAYEAFTGNPPFHGRPAHQIVAAHFRDTPPSLIERRADAPRAIAQLVARCLEKDPALRPQTATEVLNALESTAEAPSTLSRFRIRMPRLTRAAVLAMALAGGALAIRAALRVRGRAASTTTTTNAAALDQYRLGEALVRQRGAGVKKGAEAFERAIALDLGFAQAHAALATALELFPYFVGTPPSEVRDRAANAARRALELDGTLAEAHSALGEMYASTDEWDRALPEFERAIALDPDSVSIRITYGRLRMTRGEVVPGMVQFEQARRIAPVSAIVSAWIGYGLFLQGRTDSAFAEIGRAVQLDSTLLPVTNLSALMNLARGDTGAARRMMRQVPSAGSMTDAPYVFAKLGDTATAWHLVRGLESNDPRPWFTDVARASILLATGDTAHALDALEASAAASGSMWTVFIPVLDPAYESLRHSARFAALVQRAGLDVQTIAPGAAKTVR